jgi:2-amino-4-hydroxy-6-hydroxymethyldihydropteridine diphosphokinase
VNAPDLRLFVGIGSNLGDRLAELRGAAEAIAALPGLTLARGSSVWETRPVGPGSGPFLNAAVELVEVTIEPRAVLDQLLELERSRGRIRRERWGDRILDLDLLCGERGGHELVLDLPGLTLPHPELGRRDFVLQPLVDLDPELRVHGQSVADQLAALPDPRRTLLRRLDEALVR